MDPVPIAADAGIRGDVEVSLAYATQVVTGVGSGCSVTLLPGMFIRGISA